MHHTFPVPTADLQEKLQELVQQLEEIREKRLELESQMAEEDNDMMRVSVYVDDPDDCGCITPSFQRQTQL